MKGIQFFLNPPFIASMATAAKFVLPIPIFMAYLVPLDVLVERDKPKKSELVWQTLPQ
jgi:hypothetical protein